VDSEVTRESFNRVRPIITVVPQLLAALAVMLGSANGGGHHVAGGFAMVPIGLAAAIIPAARFVDHLKSLGLNQDRSLASVQPAARLSMLSGFWRCNPHRTRIGCSGITGGIVFRRDSGGGRFGVRILFSV
jgi:hypothetical protein